MQLDPGLLPDLVALYQRCQSLAMLDAIVSPEWEDRYYSFNARWGEGEAMGSMRNGSCDDWFILFGVFGAAIKGLEHETAIASDKAFFREVQAQVPRSFSAFLDESAFGWHWLSYCYWRGTQDAQWRKVIHPDPALAASEDGSVDRLSVLCESATAYASFASWYYERDLPLAAIESVYAHRPLTQDLVGLLNPGLKLDQMGKDLAAIGYPLAGV